MRIGEILVAGLFVLSIARVSSCQCVPSKRKTIWGGNEAVVMKPVKTGTTIWGTVKGSAGGEPMSGVLVEIYDHPEAVVPAPNRDNMTQKQIAACITDGSGRFSFRLPSGDYELRLSKSLEWDVTSVPLRVGKSLFTTSKHLSVHMHLGT